MPGNDTNISRSSRQSTRNAARNQQAAVLATPLPQGNRAQRRAKIFGSRIRPAGCETPSQRSPVLDESSDTSSPRLDSENGDGSPPSHENATTISPRGQEPTQRSAAPQPEATTAPGATWSSSLPNAGLEGIDEGSSDEEDDKKVTLTHERIFPADPSVPVMVPFLQLPGPRSPEAAVPPATAQWRFTGVFNPNTDETSAYASFARQLHRQLGGWEPADAPIISFPPNQSRIKCVHVTFAKQEHFQKRGQLKLRFKHSDLVYQFSGAPIPATCHVLVVSGLPAAQGYKHLVGPLQRLLGPFGRILEAWATLRAYDAIAMPPQFTGRIHILFRINDDVDDISDLPGYLLYGGGSIFLSYRGRADHCTFCRARADSIHSFNQCRRKPCLLCKETGHLTEECPKQQTME